MKLVAVWFNGFLKISIKASVKNTVNSTLVRFSLNLNCKHIPYKVISRSYLSASNAPQML